MTKKIAVFSDGTGNSSAKANKTNVWRLFQAFDQVSADQIARYDDGVGTSANRYLAAIGGAFGWGLKRNVLDLYKFICRNYSHGDEIYGFGFSRGAFTIRVLVGLIAREGLITFRSEGELARNAASAYRSYRSKAFPARYKPIVALARLLRDAVIRFRDWVRNYPGYAEVSARTARENRKDVPIRFLGLWDTVEAYGVPTVGLKRGIDRFLWPMVFGDTKLTPMVQRACHALSLDDERRTFHPLLWDEVEEARAGRRGRISQVWFAGVHSNVGGGYPEDQLSLVSLNWIMDEARTNGLRLDPHAVQSIKANQSPYAKLYDSRAGFSSYYRYAPRRIEIPRDQDDIPIRPVIHRSVLMRMIDSSDGYAPFALPHEFWILDQEGKLVPLGLKPDEIRLDASKPNAMALNSQDPDVVAAIQKLARPDRQAIGLVWDTVFWRRCLYVLTVVLSVTLVLYPWVAGTLAALASRLPFVDEVATFNRAARGPVASFVDAFSGLIPSYAAPWQRALNEHPLEFSLIAGAVLVTLACSRVLEGRIRDRARLAWHRMFRKTYNDWLEQSGKGWRNGLMALSMAGVAAFGVATLADASDSTRRFFAGVAILPLVVQLFRIAVNAERPQNASRTTIRSTMALSLARYLRESRPLGFAFRFLADQLIPIAMTFLLVAIGLFVLNRSVFSLVSAAGHYCEVTPGLDPSVERLGTAVTTFTTDRMCWPSGLVLQQGQRYEVTLRYLDDWFDRELHTDMIGLPTHGLRHVSAFLLKRQWMENWFRPVARVGEFGNDEYVLKPLEALGPRIPTRCEVPEADSMDVTEKLDPETRERIVACDPIPEDRMILRSELTARTDGELFLYVNDAVLSLPKITDLFLRNNSGSAEITVRRVTAGGADGHE